MFACLYAPELPESSRALLVNCAYGFSPRVEETDGKTVVLDIGGLERLLGPPEHMAEAMVRRAAEVGMRVRVGVAANPDAAIHAARGFEGITVIPAGREAEALGELPLEILGAPLETQETLRCWGLRRFRDLAALREAGLAERLGAEGIRLQKLARGAGERVLVPVEPETEFEEALELEYPAATIESLLFLVARLLQDLLRRLEARGLATNELRLRLRLEDRGEHARTLRLPFPMRGHKTCLKLLQLDLEMHPPRAPVVALSLGAAATDPRVVQYGLFLPPAPEPEKLELTLGRIGKLVGAGNVGVAELLDSHRPGAFRMNRSLTVAARNRSCDRKGAVFVLRVFRPALRAFVEAAGGRPSRVCARGLRGTVVSAAGPWRSSGEWWEASAWSRDEWDVALSDGALYRIYLDRRSGCWFVEGAYD